MQNDIEIKPKKDDKRVRIDWDMKENLHILTIDEAKLSDGGEYAVKAENPNGGFTLKVNVVVSDSTSSSSSSTITKTIIMGEGGEATETVMKTVIGGESGGVEGAPVMEKAPEPTVVGVGDTIRLTCSVKGQRVHSTHRLECYYIIPPNSTLIIPYIMPSYNPNCTPTTIT